MLAITALLVWDTYQISRVGTHKHATTTARKTKFSFQLAFLRFRWFLSPFSFFRLSYYSHQFLSIRISEFHNYIIFKNLVFYSYFLVPKRDSDLHSAQVKSKEFTASIMKEPLPM